jgi:hypothetical protein
MNANQVVIVDREDFKYALRCARRGDDMRLTGKYLDRLLAALDRDPDIETRIAEAIEPSVFRDDLTWSHSNMPEAGRQLARSQARSVLAVLGEEGAARNE